MRALVQRINTNPLSAKIFEWGKLITITGSAQVIVQLTGLVSGILIIRLLPTQEYALYTLANTMLGTLTVLADGGISAGVMAQGGKVWQDREKLGSVLVTGIELRKKFAIGSLLIASPLLLFLLIHHGATWLTTLLILLSLIPAFLAALSDSLLEVAPKLRQDILSLQRNLVAANIARLFLIGLTVFIFPWAFIAIIGGGLPRIWANKKLRKISAKYADWSQNRDETIKQDILAFVKRILPGSIYYCIAGQITIWLISFFGSTEKVAQLGALSRLAMALNVLGVLFNTLVSPRFARLPNDRKKLFRSYLTSLAVLTLVLFLLVVVSWLFPSQILLVLGNQNYIHLQNEFLLLVVGSCLSQLAASVYALYTSRGWMINPLLYVPINIITIILGSLLLDISSISGVMILNIIVAAVQLIMNNVFCVVRLSK